MSGARYRRGLARVRRRVRALARDDRQDSELRALGAVVLRGVVRCATCGGRVKAYAVRPLGFGRLAISRIHGRECVWVAGDPHPPCPWLHGPLSVDWGSPIPSL